MYGIVAYRRKTIAEITHSAATFCYLMSLLYCQYFCMCSCSMRSFCFFFFSATFMLTMITRFRVLNVNVIAPRRFSLTVDKSVAILCIFCSFFFVGYISSLWRLLRPILNQISWFFINFDYTYIFFDLFSLQFCHYKKKKKIENIAFRSEYSFL